MAIEPAQLAAVVSGLTSGLALGLWKIGESLLRRKRLKNQQRQIDRLEAKVDCLVEGDAETQHRLSRIEDRLNIQPSVRRVHVNGAGRP